MKVIKKIINFGLKIYDMIVLRDYNYINKNNK